MSNYLEEQVSITEEIQSRNELKGAIRFVAFLICVDGLIVLNNNLEVRGFGAVIKAIKTPKYVYSPRTSVVNEIRLTKVSPDSFGTRHRSMFSYCWTNKGSIGFVISQDGDIRAIARVNNKLIMWGNIRVLQFITIKKLRNLLTRK